MSQARVKCGVQGVGKCQRVRQSPYNLQMRTHLRRVQPGAKHIVAYCPLFRRNNFSAPEIQRLISNIYMVNESHPKHTQYITTSNSYLEDTKHKRATDWLADWNTNTKYLQRLTGWLRHYHLSTLSRHKTWMAIWRVIVQLQLGTVWLADWHVSMTYTYTSDWLTKKRTDTLLHQRTTEWLADWDIMTCLAPKNTLASYTLTGWLRHCHALTTKHITKRLTDWLNDTILSVCNETHHRTNEKPVDWLT